jgi:hypothetical protein
MASRIKIAAVEGRVAEPAHLAFDAAGVHPSEVDEQDVAGEQCGILSEGLGGVEHKLDIGALSRADVEVSSSCFSWEYQLSRNDVLFSICIKFPNLPGSAIDRARRRQKEPAISIFSR